MIGDLRDVTDEDPDLVTPQVINDILERELSNGYRYSHGTGFVLLVSKP